MEVDDNLLDVEEEAKYPRNSLAKRGRIIFVRISSVQLDFSQTSPKRKSKRIKESCMADLILCNDVFIVLKDEKKKRFSFCKRSRLKKQQHVERVDMLDINSTAYEFINDKLHLHPKQKVIVLNQTGSSGSGQFIEPKYSFILIEEQLKSLRKALNKKNESTQKKKQVKTFPECPSKETSAAEMKENKAINKSLDTSYVQSKPAMSLLEKNKRVLTRVDSSLAVEKSVGEIFKQMIACYSRKTSKVRRESSLEEEQVENKNNGYLLCLRVLEEILKTEKDYVSDLENIVKYFVLPLKITLTNNGLSPKKSPKRKNEKFLSNDDFDIIFSFVQQIMEVNSELLNSLNQSIIELNSNSPSIEKLTEVFLNEFTRVVPFLKMYSEYCHRYKNGLLRLQTLRETRINFDKFMKEQEQKSNSSLQHLLIKPVQRVCKYPLLFKELVKHMQETLKIRSLAHNQTDLVFESVVLQLTKTSAEIDAIAKNVNDKVLLKENLDLVLDTYRELGGIRLDEDEKKITNLSKAQKLYQDQIGLIPHPTRRYISRTEVLLREIAGKNSRQRAKAVIYVFNNLLVIGKLQSSSLFGLVNSPPRNYAQGNEEQPSPLSRPRRNTITSKNSNLTNAGQRSRIRMIHTFDFNNQTVRVKVPIALCKDDAGRCMFEVSISYSVGKDPRLEKFEFWCKDEDSKDHLAIEILDAVRECNKIKEEREHIRSDNLKTSDDKTNQTRLTSRNFDLRAKRKAQLKRTTTLLSQTSSSGASFSTSTLEHSVRNFFDEFKNSSNRLNDSLNLKELETKYSKQDNNKSFNGSITSTDSGGLFQRYINISLQRGELGFRLENRPFEVHSKKKGKVKRNSSSFANGVAVHVAELKSGGQAERMGLRIGDRLVSIQDVILSKETSSRAVAESLKKMEYPLPLCFERIVTS
eukprot:snap_masked-scaffold_1-processed-gene-10.27-mRNA-1 protein AED:1.00 eAED:1.00 QI:0/0/0/0/1/1/2/0/919